MGKQAEKIHLLFSPGCGGFMLADQQPEANDGLPHKLLWKEVIRTGTYRHPKKGWRLNVTTARMDRWLSNLNKQLERGDDVEIVVDHSKSARDVLGYIKAGRRDDDKMLLLHDFVGQAAIDMAGVVKNVSLGIEDDYEDSQGNKYDEAIVHSSLVQKPIVPGQSGFSPAIAASLLTLSTDTEEHEMDELLKVLQEGLGATDLTVENAAASVKAKLDEMKTSAATAAGEVKTLKEQVAALEAKVSGKTLDPDVADTMVEANEAKAEQLVEAGRITPGVKAKLLSLINGEPGKPNAFMLSRNVSGTPVAVGKQILDILAENTPVAVGEKTGGQSRKLLGRETPDGDAAEVEKRKQAQIKEQSDKLYGAK